MQYFFIPYGLINLLFTPLICQILNQSKICTAPPLCFIALFFSAIFLLTRLAYHVNSVAVENRSFVFMCNYIFWRKSWSTENQMPWKSHKFVLQIVENILDIQVLYSIKHLFKILHVNFINFPMEGLYSDQFNKYSIDFSVQSKFLFQLFCMYLKSINV